ncbi:MAG: NAD-dependent deacylase [Leptospiraceae bacterium]|nr:NAD-dependent deacylase [Leptospiraceae bacterium]
MPEIDQEIINILKKSKKVAILTGAGVSAESGIPTFRGEGGYWKNYRAEDLATPEAFSKDPKLVWEWYEMRRGVCSEAKPNRAHEVIALMENFFPEFFLITQNVDGLHRRAGNKKIVQIHGDIFTSRCTKCRDISELLDHPLEENPPKCKKCNSILRPHIVWFGETYFPGVLEESYDFLNNVDFIIIIGTSGQVSVPVQLAMYAINKGAISLEINPSHSTITESVDYYIGGAAGEVMDELWKKLYG